MRRRDRAGDDPGAAAAKALWTATEAVESALVGDGSGVPEALAARERAFEAFRSGLDATPSPAALGWIERVVETDQDLIQRANAKIAEVRGEMARSRRARGVLRTFQSEPDPARFVSERA